MNGFQPGKMANIEADILFADPRCPWNDPQSSFYGGGLCIPPYRTLAEHTWLAWSRVHPGRVVGHGESKRGPFVAVRRAESVDLLLDKSPAQVVVDILQNLAELHVNGVIHNGLSPSAFAAWDGHARIVGLQRSVLDGIGVVAPRSSPAFAAPENRRGMGSFPADLFACGSSLLALLDHRLESIPSEWREMMLAMVEPQIGDRPESVLTILREIGVDHPQTPLTEVTLAPAILQWPQGDWVWEPLLRGRPMSIVTRIDEEAEMGRGLWTLRAAAGRVLQAAHQVGGRLWSVLGTVCQIIAERSVGEDSQLHDRQALECGVRAHLPQGVPHTEDRRLRVMHFCRQHRFASALTESGSDAELRATVSWFAGDLPALRANLSAASSDAWPAARAAEAVISPDRATGDDGFPEATLDAARQLAAAGRFERCQELASKVSTPLSTRIALVMAVARGGQNRALTLATELAAAGIWDDVVVGVLVLYGQRDVALTQRARELLPSLRPVLRAEELPEALAAAATSPTPAAWERLAAGMTIAQPDALPAIAAILPIEGQVALLREAVRAGLPVQAGQIAETILSRDSQSAAGMSEIAATGLLIRNPDLVERAEARAAEVGSLDSVEMWLTAAMHHASRGDEPQAMSSLKTAGALGLQPVLMARLEAHLMPLGLWDP